MAAFNCRPMTTMSLFHCRNQRTTDIFVFCQGDLPAKHKAAVLKG